MSDHEAVRYLEILGLAPGASLADVKQAYRDLVNVWHPDRFAHNPRLRAKAEETLKDVNAAYAWLTSHPEAVSRAPVGVAPMAAAPRVRVRPRPFVLAAVVVGAAVVAVLALDHRRRGAVVVPRANDAVTASEATSDRDARGTLRPRRWPWRGVTVAAATGAVPADVRTLVGILGPRFNYVRLTLDGRTLAERDDLSPEAAWSASMAWADAMLDACRDAGIVATVVLNELPLDTDGPTETAAEFWDSPEGLDDAVRLAGELAEHLGRRGDELGGYEVLPKPFVLEGGQPRVPAQWPALLRRIVAEIRRHDLLRWIVVTPGPGGLVSGYRDFAPLDDARLVYAADTHVPSAYTRQGVAQHAGDVVYPGTIDGRPWDTTALAKSVRALRQFEQRYHVPVVIDEFGCVPWAPGRAQYLADLTSIFGTYRWGWAYLDAGRRARTPDGAPGSERWKDLPQIFARFGADPPA